MSIDFTFFEAIPSCSEKRPLRERKQHAPQR